MRTPAQRRADLLLDEPVEQWALTRRAVGLSWNQIALELRDVTDCKVTVTSQTLRTWTIQYPREHPAADAA